MDYALGEAKAEGVKYLLDIYCGVGVFALCGRAKFDRCLGVEVNPDAVRRAQQNAKLNRAENCDFIVGDAVKIFAGARKFRRARRRCSLTRRGRVAMSRSCDN